MSLEGRTGPAGRISRFGEGRSPPASSSEAEAGNKVESTRGGLYDSIELTL